MENSLENIWKQVDHIASKSNCNKRHVGCLITTGDGILVAGGYNDHENGICDCGEKGVSSAKHAEEMAIFNIPASGYGNEALYAYLNHPPCEECETALLLHCRNIKVNPTSVKLWTPTVDATLDERGSTHGDFSESSEFVQRTKEFMRITDNWQNLDSDQKEALDMIQHKIGRILYGDPTHVDHWHDIGGYAKLVEEEL